MKYCYTIVLFLLSFFNFSSANEVKIGLSAEPTSADPHYHDSFFNVSMLSNVYEPLVKLNYDMQIEPALAEKWEQPSPTTWRLHLRQGVKFHDGSNLDAADVIFSLRRNFYNKVPSSPSSFATYISSFKNVTKVDDYTIDIETKDIDSGFLNNLTYIMIVSSPDENIKFLEEEYEVKDWPGSKGFNSLELAVGTGPYKLVEFSPGDKFVLERFDDYWGEKPNVEKAYLYPMTDNGARIAALFSKQVDIIENVPVNDILRVDDTDGLNLVSSPTTVVLFFMFDQYGETTPKIEGKNPFLDVRVRKAFTMAIDREAIIDNIMQGIASPTDQMIPETILGHNPNIKLPDYDPEAAKALLAEAGYPNGFKMTINSPNDRYVNDEKITQAVSQMLSKIGIDAKIETFPRSVYFSKANNFEYSLYMGTTATEIGDASKPMKLMAHSRDLDNGMGGGNRGRYSNEKVDALIQEAFKTTDNEKRGKLYEEASQIFADDYALIPLFFTVGVHGVNDRVSYQPRPNQFMIISDIKINE